MVGKKKPSIKMDDSQLLVDTSISSPTNSIIKHEQALSLLSPQSTSSSHSSTSTSNYSFSDCKAIVKYEDESTSSNDKNDR
jgi:hypothetical protein